MSLYALMCFDKPASLDLRMANREAHLAYVRSHGAKMRVAGPFLSDSGEMIGSLIVMEAETEAEVRAFSAADPYAVAGLFERVDIRAWKVTLGALA